MKRNAPLLTLLAVAILGAALLTLSSLNNPSNSGAVAAAPPPAAVAPPPPEAAPAAPAVEAPAVAEKAYAGRAPGKATTVAIAVKDGRAVAYVCDGKKVESWMEGTLQGDKLSLKSKDGASTIEGTASETDATGTISIAGQQLPFEAKGVNAPGGLYEGRADVRGVATRIGWVVEKDGTVTGIAQSNGETRPAPPLNPADPNSASIDGVPITVTSINGTSSVIAR